MVGISHVFAKLTNEKKKWMNEVSVTQSYAIRSNS